MRAGACGAAHRLLQVMTIFSVSAIAPIKMKTVFSALVTCLLALTFSQASYAGAGYRFLLTNKMKPLAGDPGYPQLTVHVAGGYNCWYLNGIADWNQYARPGDIEINLYTERKNSLDCFYGITPSASTDVGVFVKASPDAPWVRLGTRSVLWNVGNLDNGFYIDPPLPLSGLFGMCGLTVNSLATVINSTVPGTNIAQITVSGTPKLDGCHDAYATTGAQPEAVRSSAVDGDADARNVRTIRLKVGKTRKISLAGLDPESVWELDGGTCKGDPVLTSDLKANHTRHRVLPQTVNVTAIGVGRRVCDLTAYHYPERSFVSSRRFIFIVK